MNAYALLVAAVVAELFGTTALKLSEGFSNPLRSVGVLVGYGLAFYLVSLTLEDLPLGVVYGTWAAMGIVGVAAISKSEASVRLTRIAASFSSRPVYQSMKNA